MLEAPQMRWKILQNNQNRQVIRFGALGPWSSLLKEFMSSVEEPEL
jgi:hypothetical protein